MHSLENSRRIKRNKTNIKKSGEKMLIEFFKTYGEMIIGVTLMLLLGTYWILIFRLKKLEYAMLKFDKRFERLENLFSDVGATVKNISSKISAFDMIKHGEIKVTGTTPIGNIDLNVSLGKIFEKLEKN
jgi:hypothetical protein